MTTYVKSGQEYYVTLQTDLDHDARTVEDLNRLTVRTASGSLLLPLSNVVKAEVRGDTPDRRCRVGDRIRSTHPDPAANPGYTVGEAVKFYQDLAAKQPPGMHWIKWGGQSQGLPRGVERRGARVRGRAAAGVPGARLPVRAGSTRRSSC